MKVRICDLKEGQKFELWGIERKVVKINGVNLYYTTRGHKGKQTVGKRSQQFVIVKNEKDNVS